MKLLIALLVVSALTLKVEGQGAAKAYNADCTAGTDTCTTANAQCIDNGCGTTKCLCPATHAYVAASTSCKLAGGQACTEATKATCASGECSDKFCEGTKANGATCDMNRECKTLTCKFKDGTDKCADAGSATVVASLTLMLMTFVTTRFL